MIEFRVREFEEIDIPEMEKRCRISLWKDKGFMKYRGVLFEFMFPKYKRMIEVSFKYNAIFENKYMLEDG